MSLTTSYQQQQQQQSVNHGSSGSGGGSSGGGSCYSNNNNYNNNNYGDVNCNNSTSTSVRLAGDNTKDRMYEPKHHQKAVRVLTVIAYIFFVSLAAIMLSLYYVFLWNPPQPSNLTSPMVGTKGNSIHVELAADCYQGMRMEEPEPTASLETPKAMPVVKNHNNNNEDGQQLLSTTTEMINNYNDTMTQDSADMTNTNTGGGGGGSDNINNYNNNDSDNSYYI